MKKFSSLTQFLPLSQVIFSITLLLGFLTFSVFPIFAEDDWGPSLDFDDWASLELLDEEFGETEPVRPKPLSTARSVAQPSTAAQPKRSRNQLVAYDESEESLQTPLYLTTDEAEYDDLRPKSRIGQKASVMESAVRTPVKATSSRRRPTYDLVNAEVYYDDSSHIITGAVMTEGMIFDGGMPLMANNVQASYEDVVDEGFVMDLSGYGMMNSNHAMGSGYLGMPIIKPFGTGLLDNLTFFGGVAGFKGDLDAGQNGNFGFHEGVNWSGPLSHHCIVSGQAGFRAVQSNTSGYSDVDRQSRNQYFVTGGVFLRDLSFPFQGGAVVDWVYDDYYGGIDSVQIRMELSARTFSGLEYGFQGGVGVSNDGSDYLNLRENFLRNTVDWNYVVEAKDYYTLFLRKRFSQTGLVEARLGATNRGDVVLGGNAEVAMNDKVLLFGKFSTLIPKQGRAWQGYRQESWEVSMGLVFHFRGGACSKAENPCRPMFDVVSRLVN